MSKNKFFVTALIVFSFSSLTARADYNSSLKLVINPEQHIKEILQKAPTTYNFTSQFDKLDSVSYTGQTFRLVLIEDLKTFIASQKRGAYPGTKEQAFEAFLSYVKFNNKNPISSPGSVNGSSFFGVKATDVNQQNLEIAEGYLYDDLQNPGKQLLDKLAGKDNPIRRGKLFGWNDQVQTPEELLLSWGKEFAHNAAEEDFFLVPNGNLAPQRIDSADTTPEGRNLSELTQKFLIGAVAYSQAAEDYLSTDLGPKKGLNTDNEIRYEPDANHTTLEHCIDEAFGYFGGARDFKLYTDTQSASGFSIDTNQDGQVSMLSEKNLGLAKNFGRVDRSAKDGTLNLSNDIITSFINARYLAATKPAGYRDYVIAYSEIALGTWEKTFGALSITYINNLIKAYDAYGTAAYNFKNLAKFWSELKGFSLGLQFSPKALLSDADFDKFHTLISDRPVLPDSDAAVVDHYKKALIEARTIMQKAYGYSDVNVQGW